MENEISQALTLMGIGMITVFVVLSLVVVIGNLLIQIVNRFAPVPISPEKKPEISNAKIAAITAAVEMFTAGKGRITKIEKK
ncbi:MAG: OadG family transporter subunit [Cytophagales bacterium]|nr:OadG family transporter subunit [Cytophagales bacterium]